MPCIVLTAVFPCMFLLQMIVGFARSVQSAALVKPLIREGEVWRLLSAALLHGSWRHLSMNLTASFAFGIVASIYTSPSIVIPLFLVSALGGNLASLLLLDAPSLGASGGLSGFLGFLGVLWLLRRSRFPSDFGKALLVRAILPTALMGLIGYRVIDNAAHLGGLVTGAVLGLLVAGRSKEKPLLPEPKVLASLHRVGLVVLLSTATWTAARLVMG